MSKTNVHPFFHNGAAVSAGRRRPIVVAYAMGVARRTPHPPASRCCHVAPLCSRASGDMHSVDMVPPCPACDGSFQQATTTRRHSVPNQTMPCVQPPVCSTEPQLVPAQTPHGRTYCGFIGLFASVESLQSPAQAFSTARVCQGVRPSVSH